MKTTIKNILLMLAVFVLVAAGIIFYLKDDLNRWFFKPNTPPINNEINAETKKQSEIIAENLKIPWEIVFLPGGDMLVTERPGTLLKIGKDKKVYNISGVKHRGEGGLLGMTLHPQFNENHFIYLYLTAVQSDGLINKVERYQFQNNELTDRKIIIDNIPGANYHDGGRIEFGPDGFLYITTGDSGKSNLAQDKNSLAGKILRVTSGGNAAPGNPFNNLVYSYGHRNPQ